MITQAVCDAIANVVSFIVSLLPTTPTPPNFAGALSSAIGGVNGYFGVFASVFPVDELGTAIAAMLLFMVAIHGFRLFSWVLTLIHVSGDRG